VNHTGIDFEMTPLTPEELQALVEQSMRLAGKAQQIMSEFWVRQMQSGTSLSADPMGLAQTWTSLAQSMMADPQKLVELQSRYWQDTIKVWQNFFHPPGSDKPQPVVHARPGDKRFSAKDWHENQIFDFVRQSYLLTAKYLMEAVQDVHGLSPKEKAKAEFFTRQFIDAVSPSNFLLTNPQAIRTTIEQKGQNLLKGLENLLEDLGQGRIAMTDYSAFEVGRNVAVTPGKVVFENPLFQLIQYAPATETVYEVPLVIIPPWINKFYILDLTAEKSMVRWLVDQGITVFMISWVNPDSAHRETKFEDYALEGVLAALKAVRTVTGVKHAQVIGYCVAGTLLAATLAYLARTGEAGQIAGATFFTAQVDFSEAGDLCVFVDDPQLESIDKATAETGYTDASYMATTFNLLRSNDLIWSYVVNNYLLGKDPFPFDLLYWNSDATRMPRAMHLYYLRNMYLENNLVKPDTLAFDGVPLDLRLVKTPVFVQAGREDHIAPPQSVYKMRHHFTGPITFMLAGSGHIAGVVNPPASKKYQYWTNPELPADYADFVKGATEHPGSWWPFWLEWLTPQLGAKVPARTPGAGKLKAIEDAPGRYVKAQ